MRANYMKTKSRSKSKRRRSLRKKSGGGIADWFNSEPSNAADDALPWYKKITSSLTNLFSSAPPVPENVAPPPRPGQPPASVEPEPEPPGQPGQQTAPVPEPAPTAPTAPTVPDQQAPTAPTAPTAPEPAVPFGNQTPTEPVFGEENKLGGKRTRKRRHPKKKRSGK